MATAQVPTFPAHPQATAHVANPEISVQNTDIASPIPKGTIIEAGVRIPTTSVLRVRFGVWGIRIVSGANCCKEEGEGKE